MITGVTNPKRSEAHPMFSGNHSADGRNSWKVMAQLQVAIFAEFRAFEIFDSAKLTTRCCMRRRVIVRKWLDRFRKAVSRWGNIVERVHINFDIEAKLDFATLAPTKQLEKKKNK